MIDAFVHGVPVPKGSARAFVHRATGRAIVTADNARTKPWQQQVAGALMLCGERMLGPVRVELAFTMPRPKGHYGKHGVRPSAPAHCTTKPDLDKLVRAVLDALTDAGVWQDDSQVVELVASKDYGSVSGVRITVAAVSKGG